MTGLSGGRHKLRGPFGEYVIAELGETIEGGMEEEVYDHFLAENFLRDLMHDDPINEAILRDVCGEAMGQSDLSGDDNERVIQELAHLLVGGSLRVFRLPETPLVPLTLGPRQAEEAPPAPEPAAEPEWIEICLLDEHDQPVDGARYEVALPDGRVRQGQLSAQGLAYLGGLKPGNCVVVFPDLDGTVIELEA